VSYITPLFLYSLSSIFSILKPMFIVDGHLDLAYNVTAAVTLRFRAQQPVTHNEIPTTGLPDLRAAGRARVRHIFAEPCTDKDPGYTTPNRPALTRSANCTGTKQEAEGRMSFIRARRNCPHSLCDNPARHPVARRADPLRTPADVAEWHASGLRIVGLAWRRTATPRTATLAAHA